MTVRRRGNTGLGGRRSGRPPARDSGQDRRRHDHRLPLPCRQRRRPDRAVGHGGAARRRTCAAPRRPASTRTVLLCGVPFRLRGRQPRGRAHRREPARPLLRLRVRPRRARPRPRCRAGATTAVERYGFVGIKVHRHDARHHREICEVARAFAAAGAVRRRWARSRSSSCWPPSIPTSNFIIPHLGSFADDWRAQLALDRLPGAPSEHLHRHVRRTPLRPAGAGGASARARARSCSAPTGRGCIRASSSRRSARSGFAPADEAARARRKFPPADRRRVRPGRCAAGRAVGPAAEVEYRDPWRHPITSRRDRRRCRSAPRPRGASAARGR